MGEMLNEEMRKFRTLLDAEHIEWNDLSDNGAYPMCRTHFEYNGQRWSVVHGYGSYGGYDFFTGADKGLLEVYNFVEEPKGFLTAENAMQYVKGAKELIKGAE